MNSATKNGLQFQALVLPTSFAKALTASTFCSIGGLQNMLPNASEKDVMPEEE